MKDKNNNDTWDATYYKKHSDPAQLQRGMQAISLLKLQENKTVLDVGCGDGRITAEIARHVSRGFVHGIDISASMINEAQMCFKDIKNLSFEQADAVTWHATKKFDLVVSFAAFHWIKDQLQALKNIYEALNNGGRLIMIMDAGGNPSINRVLTGKQWATQIYKNDAYHPLSQDEMINLLKQCSFSSITISVKNNIRTFMDTEVLAKWICNWLPSATGLHGEKIQELASDIVEAICTDQNKRIHLEIEAPTLYVNAVRP